MLFFGWINKHFSGGRLLLYKVNLQPHADKQNRFCLFVDVKICVLKFLHCLIFCFYLKNCVLEIIVHQRDAIDMFTYTQDNQKFLRNEKPCVDKHTLFVKSTFT